MALGCTCVGVHMAMTQGVLFGMISSVVPTQAVPGLGRISGTVWSLTDLMLGERCCCGMVGVAGWVTCDRVCRAAVKSSLPELQLPAATRLAADGC